MQVIMYQANAFTDKLFEGSPIGIVPDARNLEEEDMKRIVRITNLNKIAFIVDEQEEKGCYNLRFFNSEEEISSCDCAAVASFYALAERGYIKGVENGTVRVYECTGMGKRPIDIYFHDWKVDKVELCEQSPISIEGDIDLNTLSLLLNIDKEDIGLKNLEAKPEIMFKGYRNMVVPVKTSKILESIVVDIEKIKAQDFINDIDKLYVFSIDEDEVINYLSFEFNVKENCRYEDANSAFIYYIKKNKFLNKDHFIYKEKSPRGRHNHMNCELIGSKDNHSVRIGGRASIYLEGVVTYR